MSSNRWSQPLAGVRSTFKFMKQLSMFVTLARQQLDALVSEVGQFQARSAGDDCFDVISEPKAGEIATRAPERMPFWTRRT